MHALVPSNELAKSRRAIHTVVRWGLRDMSVHRFEYTTPLLFSRLCSCHLSAYVQLLNTASTTRDTPAVSNLVRGDGAWSATQLYNRRVQRYLPATQNACQSTDFEVRFESAMNLPPNEPPVRLRHSGFRFRSGWTKGSLLAGLPTSPRMVSPPLAACVAHLPQLPSSLSLSLSLLFFAPLGVSPITATRVCRPVTARQRLGWPLCPHAPRPPSRKALRPSPPIRRA